MLERVLPYREPVHPTSGPSQPNCVVVTVSQEVTLFDDTIRAKIALGRIGASQADIAAAAKAAAAHDFIMAQPQGCDTVIGDSGLRLSGGQRQRVGAILKDSPILLLERRAFNRKHSRRA